MYVLRSIETRSRDHCRRRKAISITYSECVSVGLAIQHAMRMRRILFSSVASLALQCFPALSKKEQFSKKKLHNTKFVL
jgi:hypothetical protein